MGPVNAQTNRNLTEAGELCHEAAAHGCRFRGSEITLNRMLYHSELRDKRRSQSRSHLRIIFPGALQDTPARQQQGCCRLHGNPRSCCSGSSR